MQMLYACQSIHHTFCCVQGMLSLYAENARGSIHDTASSSVFQVAHAPALVAATQAPQGDCCQPAPMPSPPSEAVVKKEQKIREVHVSAALMEEFLRSAHLLHPHEKIQRLLNSLDCSGLLCNQLIY